ncbi:hypothetical protein BKA67DRAFT_571453, partial [Truncatella angustata]
MAGRSISRFLELSYRRVENAVADVDWDKLGKDVVDFHLAAGKGVENTFHNVSTLVKETDWAELGRNATETVKNNPKTVLVPVGVVGGAVTGGLLMGPVLCAVGFSSIGPVAGSVAAGVQSAGAAGALFSTLQSAAMGGYGLAGVLTSFAGVGAAAGAAVGVASGNAVDFDSAADPGADHEGDSDSAENASTADGDGKSKS